MTNPYEQGSLRYNIREATTDLKEAVVEPVKKGWELIPEEKRQSISKGAGEFAQDFGTAWEGTKRIDNRYDPTEYAAAGTAYALEGIGAGFDWLTNQVAQKTGVDPAVVAVAEMFVPWSKLGKLGKVGKLGKATKLTNAAKNLNRLDVNAFSFAQKVDKITGGNTQFEVMQMLSKTDNLDGIFSGRTNQLIQDYKKASGGFNIPKLEKTIQASITKHQLPTNLKAYKKINVRKYNKYINDELKHWAEHGKGSGKYFNIEHSTNPNLNISYRLDQKSNPSKILDASGNIIDRSFSVTDLLNKKIQNLSQADRLILLQNTTLDKATVSKVAKLTPGGKIMHHAAPVQSTSKIQKAFFKANPNLTMDDWIPIQRKVEKEFNFAFGDSPLNARYPETIAQHEKYHGLLREAGLYPNQLKFPEGLSPDAAYKKLKHLAKTVLEIDQKVGVKPDFTSKTIGKQFGKRSQ